MRERLQRRHLLRAIGRLGALGLAIPVTSWIPEARRSGQSANRIESRLLASHDPSTRRVLDTIRRTAEWAAHHRHLVSEEPFAYTRTPDGDHQLIGFGLWDDDPKAIEARKFGSFQLLRELLFITDGRAVVAVFVVTPDELTARATWRELRTGEVGNVDMSPSARSSIASARAKADDIRRRLPTRRGAAAASGGKLAAPLTASCDCYPDRWYCGQTVTVQGYVDEGCYWVCSVGCTLTTVARWACLVGCRAGCYVPGYSYCASWYCGPCLT